MSKKLNLATRFLDIFVASEAQRIYVKEKYVKQKYGIFDAYINNKKLRKQSFVFAPMNAACCIGEQDQKISTRFLDIFVASGAKCIYVKEQNIINKNTASSMPT